MTTPNGDIFVMSLPVHIIVFSDNEGLPRFRVYNDNTGEQLDFVRFCLLHDTHADKTIAMIFLGDRVGVHPVKWLNVDDS